jgi:methylmalonyl-CoA mutase N-terminal domain/subunit
VQAALDRGLAIDDFAPRLSFFFNVHNDFLEEVAKFRAARRLWAKLVQERFAPRDPKSTLLRFHAQTAGSTLIAQQVDTNVVRVSMQCLAAALGGAQSVHTNSRDEALGLPTEQAATLALRTQQVIAYETGITQIVDPFGGSYAIEAMTDAIEREAQALIGEIEGRGGVVACLRDGWQQPLIQEASYRYQLEIENKQRVIVGLNHFTEAQASPPVLTIDPRIEKEQVERLKRFKANRDQAKAGRLRESLRSAATENRNIVPAIFEAVKGHITLGEIVETLTAVYGRYRP